MAAHPGYVRQHREIRRQTLSALHERGFLTDSDVWRRFGPDVRPDPGIWDSLARTLAADEASPSTGLPPYEVHFQAERLGSISGWGAVLGRILCSVFGVEEPHVTCVTTATALFNTLACLFDRICDDIPELFPALTRSIDIPRLDRALSVTEGLATRVLPHSADSDPALALVSLVAERCFSECRALYAASNRQDIWHALRRGVFRSYDAEVGSRNLLITASLDLDHVSARLREKSSGLAWILCLITLLAPTATRAGDLCALEEFALRLGDVFWIADDLVDAAEDVSRQRWSYPWLKLARSGALSLYTSHGELRAVEQLLEDLISSGVVVEAAADLCECYAAGMRFFEQNFGRCEALGALLRVGVQNWLETLSTASRGGDTAQRTEQARIRSAIDDAVSFIREGQLDSGMFLTVASPRPDLDGAGYVRSVYVPTYIIHGLTSVRSLPGAEEVIRRAARALHAQREPGGVWRFFGPDSLWPPPDFDDTCCVLAALKEASVEVESAVFDLLGRSAAETGGFFTWIDSEANRQGGFHVDAAVNANIIFHGGLCGRSFEGAIRHLNECVARQPLRTLSIYALSEFPVIYLIMRAYRDAGVHQLQASARALESYLLEQRRDDGSWGNELDTALAFTSLMNTGYRASGLDVTGRWLLDRQRPNGGWGAWAFFQDFLPTYYASAELTTTLCVEALVKWARGREVLGAPSFSSP